MKTSYQSEAITIGKGTAWELDGILTMPQGASAEHPVPALVLVHGSGPQDKDETVGACKPFLDLADYLSSHGVAVIRYEKRTLTHGEKMMEALGNSLTVWEETIEDAILAGVLAKADPRIDPKRVFMLGHSLGGVLALRTQAMGGDFAGLILFAASPRLLTDIIIHQNQMVLDSMEAGPEKAAVEAQVAALVEQIRAILEMTAEEAKEADFFGMSAYYLKDMQLHPFERYVADTQAPILVMHGERDLQVLTDVDFAVIQELLAGRENTEFRLYEGLNHLFMPSTAAHITEVMAEYEKPAKMDGQVLGDILAWIEAH